MTFRIWADKVNTISSRFPSFNASQSQTMNLIYGGSGSGHNIQRGLVYFDLSELQEKISSLYINTSITVTYTLHFKNSVPSKYLLESEFIAASLKKNIASSFDLFAVPINISWDQGLGSDLQKQNYAAKSFGGQLTLSGVSNWLSATSLNSWSEPGIYTNPTASTTPFYSTQHFETGGENLSMDITNIVNNWLSGGSQNNGLEICFGYNYEKTSGNTQYVASFYSNKVNSSFGPYLEANSNQVIKDGRNAVSNNNLSTLFLYTFSGHTPVNYFSAGTVNIVGPSGSVVISGLTPTLYSQGAYYVNFILTGATKNQLYKDVWSNITFNAGIDQTTVTQTFEIRNNSFLFAAQNINEYSISTVGIDNNSLLPVGQVLRVYIDTKKNYSLQRPETSYGLQFRLVMNNISELIPWSPTNDVVIDGILRSFIDIDTSWLLTNQSYEISFRIIEYGTLRMLTEAINFRVVESYDKIKLN